MQADRFVSSGFLVEIEQGAVERVGLFRPFHVERCSKTDGLALVVDGIVDLLWCGSVRLHEISTEVTQVTGAIVVSVCCSGGQDDDCEK